MRQLFEGYIEVYAEICCEVCNEIVHNHIDCPVCGKKYAETENYYPLYEDDRPLECECGAKFILVSGSPYGEAVWKEIKCKDKI